MADTHSPGLIIGGGEGVEDLVWEGLVFVDASPGDSLCVNRFYAPFVLPPPWRGVVCQTLFRPPCHVHVLNEFNENIA